MQALASRPALTELALHSSGLSCSPVLLGEGVFSVLQSLELAVPPAPQQQTHQFLESTRCVTALKLSIKPSLRSIGYKRKREQAWQLFRDTRLLTTL
jgi:hypothetical protein